MNAIAFPFIILVYIGVVFVGVWLLLKVLTGVGWLLGMVFGTLLGILGRIFAFVRDEIGDALRVVGGMITSALFTPLILANVLIGRWSAARHYGSEVENELVGVAQSLYRVVVGNVSRLLGLSGLTDGIENRIPSAMARAPGSDRPGRKTGHFDGYKVVGSLQAGGSGAKLWLAEPSRAKRDQLAGAGRLVPSRVVIKSFALADGSTLPQIVRENRALEAASQLGLVLEHDMTPSRFHYVMPYVPGDDLGSVARNLHDRSGRDGLNDKSLGKALGYGHDLLSILHDFHTNGLWHKDVKPSNVIVAKDGVHLVDLGLLTPLRSAMTLTTHGTEYFRDPELVRLAMRGVKVHEVDGVKFDVYSAGAVLYSILEGSFPAHGSLSQITKRCPEALKWIVRRAMADMSHRYGSAAEMLADLQAVQEAGRPFAVKPAGLPSVRGDTELVAALSAQPAAEPVFASGTASVRRPQARPFRDAVHERARPSRAGKFTFGTLAAIGLLAFLAVSGALYTGQRRDSVIPPFEAGSSMRMLSPDRQLLTMTRPPAQPPAPVATVTLPEGARRTVLVVDDLATGADDTVREQVESVLLYLDQADFHVLGRPDDGLSDDARIGLMAGARKTAGLSHPANDEASRQLLDFVEQRDEVDGMLWIGSGENDMQYTCRIIADSDALSDDLKTLVELAGDN